jgi:hypothetical protein
MNWVIIYKFANWSVGFLKYLAELTKSLPMSLDQYYWFHSTVAQVIAGLLAYLGALYFFGKNLEITQVEILKKQIVHRFTRWKKGGLTKFGSMINNIDAIIEFTPSLDSISLLLLIDVIERSIRNIDNPAIKEMETEIIAIRNKISPYLKYKKNIRITFVSINISFN